MERGIFLLLSFCCIAHCYTIILSCTIPCLLLKSILILLVELVEPHYRPCGDLVLQLLGGSHIRRSISGVRAAKRGCRDDYLRLPLIASIIGIWNQSGGLLCVIM